MVVSAHGNSLRSLLATLREHTLGRMLTDEEMIKLEVPNSVPITIRFDKQLNHEEKWSNQKVLRKYWHFYRLARR